VYIQLPEDFRRVEEMLVFKDLLRIPCQERQIQEQSQPISVDEEECGKEGVYSGFGDDVCVETVAEIDGVDVITFQIAIHDGEEDLKEQIDGIYQHRQQIEPRFSRHYADRHLGSFQQEIV